MHRAAETNQVEMLDFLLANGLALEVKSKYGETPVVVAALHEATEAVLYLMGKKANMHAKSFDGLTPFQISAKYGFPEMMRALFVEGGGEPRCLCRMIGGVLELSLLAFWCGVDIDVDVAAVGVVV